MVGLHHRLYGHEFDQALGVGDGQGSLVLHAVHGVAKSWTLSNWTELRWNQNPAPRLHYCFLAAPPLFLHPFPSWINNSLNLPFGTQGRSWRLESINREQKDLCSVSRLMGLGVELDRHFFSVIPLISHVFLLPSCICNNSGLGPTSISKMSLFLKSQVTT